MARHEDFHVAIPLYERLIKQFPTEVELWLQLTHCLGLSGRREEAYELQTKLISETGGPPDLLLRIARDREVWKDFEGALDIYVRLAERESNWQSLATFHTVRLSERLNRTREAASLLEKAKEGGFHQKEWNWLWMEGVLARRAGAVEKAARCFEAAEPMASGLSKATVCSAQARLADARGEIDAAAMAISKLRQIRAAEVEGFKGRLEQETQNHLSDLSVVPESHALGPILIAGLPRSGTTLLGRILEEKFETCLSDEHNYLNHVVRRFASRGSGIGDPRRLREVSAVARKEAVESYFAAQGQTVGYDRDSDQVLIDKNQSMTPLIPWLLELVPGLRILWVARNLADCWLSSVMQDVPINRATCWWQNPKDYGNWARDQVRLLDSVEERLPRSRFKMISYPALVGRPESIANEVGELFGLKARTTPVSRLVARSPSYADVECAVRQTRVDRWSHYRDFFGGEDREELEKLDGEITFRDATR